MQKTEIVSKTIQLYRFKRGKPEFQHERSQDEIYITYNTITKKVKELIYYIETNDIKQT